MHTGDASVGAMTANAIVGGNLPIAAGRCPGFQDAEEGQRGGLLLRRWRQQRRLLSRDDERSRPLEAAGDLRVREQYVLRQTPLSASPAARRTWPPTGRHLWHPQPRWGWTATMSSPSTKPLPGHRPARAGEGPTIIEVKTYRHGGHSRNDACGYRPKDEAITGSTTGTL